MVPRILPGGVVELRGLDGDHHRDELAARMKAFLAVLALIVAVVLCCGWFARGIDPPPINTPTPIEESR